MRIMSTTTCFSRLLVLTAIFAFHVDIAAAQVEITPGESVQSTFLDKRQEQEYTVDMTAGERLRLHIRSVGETLFTDFEIFDPVGNRIARGPGRSLQHDFTTPVLSADGRYLVTVRNKRGVGTYTISIGTIASDGRQILPGSRGP